MDKAPLMPHLTEYSNQNDNTIRNLVIDLGPMVGAKVIKILTLRHKTLLSALRYESESVEKTQGALTELEDLVKEFHKVQ